MFTAPYNIIDLAVKASVFALVLAFWCGALWLWSLRRKSHKRKVEQQLGLVDPQSSSTRVLRLWYDGQEATTAVPDAVPRRSLKKKLHKLRDDAGLRAPLQSLVLAIVGSCTLVFVFAFALTARPLLGVAAVGTILMILWIVLTHRVSRRMTVFEEQLVDALDLAARSLRAGHPLIGAFQLVSEETPGGVGSLFGEVCQQQQLGVSLEEALSTVAASSSSKDVKLLAASVIIQLRSGGNLAEMMETLAHVIRDRARINRRTRVLMAQTQLSKKILTCMPIGMFFLVNILNPGYMVPLLETEVGRVILTFGVVFLLVGIWMMNRMAVLRY